MRPMIAAALLMMLPEGPLPELRTGQAHLAAEVPRMHAAPGTLLDNRLAAALQTLAGEAGFPESPILFTESGEVLALRGSGVRGVHRAGNRGPSVASGLPGPGGRRGQGTDRCGHKA